MTFVTSSETGTTSEERPHPGQVLIRKVTESQGARSEFYEVHDATAKSIGYKSAKRTGWSTTRGQLEHEQTDVAAAEHIGRHLRECQKKSEELLEAVDDPIQSALIGSSLASLLQELWAYREAREPDWIELLNILQIVLARQQFENLSRERRQVLSAALREGLASYTIGPSDVSRTLDTLSRAGFDIWRGLEDFAPQA